MRKHKMIKLRVGGIMGIAGKKSMYTTFVSELNSISMKGMYYMKSRIVKYIKIMLKYLFSQPQCRIVSHPIVGAFISWLACVVFSASIVVGAMFVLMGLAVILSAYHGSIDDT